MAFDGGAFDSGAFDVAAAGGTPLDVIQLAPILEQFGSSVSTPFPSNLTAGNDVWAMVQAPGTQTPDSVTVQGVAGTLVHSDFRDVLSGTFTYQFYVWRNVSAGAASLTANRASGTVFNLYALETTPGGTLGQTFYTNTDEGAVPLPTSPDGSLAIAALRSDNSTGLTGTAPTVTTGASGQWDYGIYEEMATGTGNTLQWTKTTGAYRSVKGIIVEPPVAPVLVQTTSVGSADFANASVTFASPVTPGNTLIIYGAVEEFGTPAPALSSNQGDTFVTTSQNNNNNAAVLARVDSAVGGSTTITLSGGSFHRLVAQEWSGLTYDSGAGTGTATASGTITASTPNSTTSANSVVFSSWAVRTGEDYTSQQVPTGYTEAGRFVSIARGKFIGAHRAETTTGVKSAEWVDPGVFPDQRAAIIFAFRALGSGGGGGPTIVTGSASGAWSVRNFATGSQGGAWSVRNLVTGSRTGAWSVRNFASASQAGAWSVRNFASATQAGAWSVRNFVTGSVSGAWSVEGALNIVTGSASGAWSVRNFVSATQPGAWSVRNFVTASRTGAWSVRNFASATRSGAWSVRAFATGSRTGAWSVRNYAFGFASGAWSVNSESITPLGGDVIYLRRRRR